VSSGPWPTKDAPGREGGGGGRRGSPWRLEPLCHMLAPEARAAPPHAHPRAGAAPPRARRRRMAAREVLCRTTRPGGAPPRTDGVACEGDDEGRAKAEGA
jgi:hypothetical protein